MLGFASSCKIYNFSRACELRPKELVGTGKMCSFIKRFRYIETLSGAKNMVPYIKDFVVLRFIVLGIKHGTRITAFRTKAE